MGWSPSQRSPEGQVRVPGRSTFGVLLSSDQKTGFRPFTHSDRSRGDREALVVEVGHAGGPLVHRLHVDWSRLTMSNLAIRPWQESSQTVHTRLDSASQAEFHHPVEAAGYRGHPRERRPRSGRGRSRRSHRPARRPTRKSPAPVLVVGPRRVGQAGRLPDERVRGQLRVGHPGDRLDPEVPDGETGGRSAVEVPRPLRATRPSRPARTRRHRRLSSGTPARGTVVLSGAEDTNALRG